MEKFCPLCMKKGVRRRIRTFQINLEEAVSACEDKDCIWPMGYEELVFFQRKAVSYNWEEPSLTKESISMPIELSLYTPPETPGEGELSKEVTDGINMEHFLNPLTEDKLGEISYKNESSSTKEHTDFNKLSWLEPLELQSNSASEKSKSITKEKDASDFKTLPTIIDMQNTNLNLTIFSSIEHCDNQKQEQRHLLTDATITDIHQDLDSLLDDMYKEFDLNTQCRRESEQNKSDKVQLGDTTNVGANLECNNVETNFSIGTPSHIVKSPIDANITNSLNRTNDSILNISDRDLDTKLQSNFLTYQDYVTEEADDWLNLLVS